jgi:chromosome segregation ATPase
MSDSGHIVPVENNAAWGPRDALYDENTRLRERLTVLERELAEAREQLAIETRAALDCNDALAKERAALAAAREKVTSLQAAVMAHKTWENEAVAQASNANFAHNKIRVELAAARAEVAAERIENTHLREAFVAMERAYNQREAEVERAVRFGYNWDRDHRDLMYDNGKAAWTRYQQERNK